MNFYILLNILFAHFCISEGYKILAVFTFPAHSHYTVFYKVVSELVTKGHDVTFVTPYPQKTTPKNFREVSVEALDPILKGRKINLWSLNELSAFANVPRLSNLGYNLTEKTLENENMQKILHSNEQYDLILLHYFLNEALFGIADHFKAPLVLLSSMPLWTWSSFYLRHPSPSSYVPNVLTCYTGRMNFWQRLSNTIHDTYSILYHSFFILPKQGELVKNYIPGQPDLYKFLNNASLTLINTHTSTHETLPQVPNSIEMGGIHLEHPKKLPQTLQKFLDESTDGVIVFAMGSNLKSSDLPVSLREAILKTFSRLKQNVLWKWEADNLPNQPKNVKIMKWLPQNDLLAHPNVKGFVTHGGVLSTMESIYHGVPVIGIPVFADQKMNIATAASKGYAVVVPFQELSEEKLFSALSEILNNPKYKQNAQKSARIMRDRPMEPLEEAIYWIEYVIRHRGAPHLRYPGTDLTWFQRNLLDIVAFIVVSLGIVLPIVVVIVRRASKSRNGDKIESVE